MNNRLNLFRINENVLHQMMDLHNNSKNMNANLKLNQNEIFLILHKKKIYIFLKKLNQNILF